MFQPIFWFSTIKKLSKLYFPSLTKDDQSAHEAAKEPGVGHILEKRSIKFCFKQDIEYHLLNTIFQIQVNLIQINAVSVNCFENQGFPFFSLLIAHSLDVLCLQLWMHFVVVLMYYFSSTLDVPFLYFVTLDVPFEYFGCTYLVCFLCSGRDSSFYIQTTSNVHSNYYE